MRIMRRNGIRGGEGLHHLFEECDSIAPWQSKDPSLRTRHSVYYNVKKRKYITMYVYAVSSQFIAGIQRMSRLVGLATGTFGVSLIDLHVCLFFCLQKPLGCHKLLPARMLRFV